MKSTNGNFFEDFHVGRVIHHATPRTVTAGDIALYTALYGGRFGPQSSSVLARSLGYPEPPVDDMLVFNMVFGKSVPDISLNAVANLGYAECRFRVPVFPGDTLSASSEIVGLRETSSGEAGIVWVHTTGANQRGDTVLDYVRWVLVQKRDRTSSPPRPVVPALTERVDPATLGTAVPRLAEAAWDKAAAGSPWTWADYAPGERIDHIDGMALEEAEHQLATRLYQNTARVHFDAHAAHASRLGRRLVYGGVVMSIARALSFNGLGCAFHVAAINGGRHVSPCIAGDTIHATSEVLECARIPGRNDIAALRTLLTATARRLDATAPVTLLELDLWLAAPASRSSTDKSM